MWVGSKSTNFAPHSWFTFALSFITKSTLFFWIKWITLCVWPRWWTVCSVWVYWLARVADTILYVPQPVQQHTTPLCAHNSTCEWCTLPRERERERNEFIFWRGAVLAGGAGIKMVALKVIITLWLARGWLDTGHHMAPPPVLWRCCDVRGVASVSEQ